MTVEVRQTDAFRRWLTGLRDRRGRGNIVARLSRLEDGHFGDHRSVGEGVGELRIHAGPGYRAYYVRRGDTIVVMLCGGDKGTQMRDIARAKTMATEVEE